MIRSRRLPIFNIFLVDLLLFGLLFLPPFFLVASLYLCIMLFASIIASETGVTLSLRTSFVCVDPNPIYD